MNILDRIFRFLVGGLFIFSGLIKVNDPYGTAIKLEEYFEVFAVDFGSFFHVFTPHALTLSVIFVVLETLLGVAVILNYRPKISYWVILLLIIFFTFLTFYSAVFDKVTDCGCFGDAIPLTPEQSFIKDLFLLAFILFLFIRRKIQQPLLSRKTGDIGLVVSTIILLFIAIYSIRHLPYIDFRPYKIGNNIAVQMEPSERLDYDYIMEKDGREKTFDEYPTDTTYTFVEMKLTNPRALPKVTDYSLWNGDDEYTEESLTGNKLFIIIQEANKVDREVFNAIGNITEGLGNGIEPVVITSSAGGDNEALFQDSGVRFPFYFGDATLLKAVIRSNPGLVLLQDGTVLNKWHYNDLPTAEEINKEIP